MKARTTILLDEPELDHLKDLARRRDTTVTQLIREAVAEYLAGDDPNAGLLSLVGLWEGSGVHPPVDSDEAQEQLYEDLRRDTFALAPDE